MFSRNYGKLLCGAVLTITLACRLLAGAQETLAQADRRNESAKRQGEHRAAGSRLIPNIHWQRVPLYEAIQRLKQLFDDGLFVDRRIDPNTRVSLDIEANAAEAVLTALAPDHDWAILRLNKLVYLGPSSAAAQLRAVARARVNDVVALPASQRAQWTRGERTIWPRLSEPRSLTSDLVSRRGWRVANPAEIPHDLWAAGELPEMPLAEQLSVLLIGFDLTFKLEPKERTIEIVPLDKNIQNLQSETKADRALERTSAPPRKPEGKRAYTLRVNEQPVRAILGQLAQRLHWPIEIDEESLRAAGKSLDTRVSFSVENVDQDQLLKAILGPAGLTYRLENNRVRITASGND